MSPKLSEALTDSITILLEEIEAGRGLTMGPAGRVLGGTDPSTIFRFITRGSKSVSGELVKLEATRIGSKWWTTRPAIARFMRALTNPAVMGVPKPTAKKKKSNAAARLQALGC